MGKDEKASVDFWKEYLKDCPVDLKFPYDYPRKNSPSGLGYRESLIISEETTIKLKGLSKSVNSSLSKTMLSILGALMQKYTSENDICIGFPVSNRRTHSYLEEIFGFLWNHCF